MHDAHSGPRRWIAAVRQHSARQGTLAIHLLRWVVLGAAAGVLAGVASFAFLESLDWATEQRLGHPWLVWLLPPMGLVVGLVYHLLGGRAAQGSALLLDEIHQPTAWVPRRMAPLVYGGTVASQLVGASVGREGAALQLSGSLNDLLARTLRLTPGDRRLLLVAALGGGFGAVFGVPLAGAVFALEVQAVGRVRYEALVPALAASIVGDLVVEGLGYEHDALPQLDVGLDAGLVARVAVAGLLFGLAAAAFVELTDGLRTLVRRYVGWAPLRPVLGGVATLALMGMFGRDYLGLSLPLIGDALSGAETGWWVPVLKIVFTAVALGSGFPGGEVTPLFVIGVTAGAALADPLGLDVTLLAAIGFVAVFAGAANTPLACTIMGAELFGAEIVVYLAVGCVVAYVFSDHRGIYSTQRIDTAKGPETVHDQPTLHSWRTLRRRSSDDSR